MLHPYAQAQKQDSEIPDAYGMTIYFRNGHQETFEVASHAYVQDMNPPFLEIITHDNKWNTILWEVVSRVEFDKRYSKLREIAARRMREEVERKKLKENDDEKKDSGPVLN